MSKWKFIRKRKLSCFEATKHAEGFLFAAFLSALLSSHFVLAAGFLILLYGVHTWSRCRFSKIEKAIEDATGDES